MMTHIEISIRLDKLRNVLAYSLERGNYYTLTAEQRICINRERAALMHAADEMADIKASAISIDYTVPAHIDDRVQAISRKIVLENWNMSNYR